jgi:hypothetical protein
MKLTVEIPDKALRDLVKFTKAQTKRAAVLHAVGDFNRRFRMARLIRHAGTFQNFMSQEELGNMRREAPLSKS